MDLIDLLLSDISAARDSRSPALEKMLLEGGSGYCVARHGARIQLEHRVDETVTASAEAAMTTSGTGGKYLAEAWAQAYGRSPDPSSAYAAAVKAVEAAAQPVVTPNDTETTLGKMIPALRDAPQKWEVVIAARPNFDRVKVVRLMADLLWQGHTDRHGTANPIPVTQAQCEAAVQLAVTLVHWFTAGSIRSAT